MTAKKMFSTTVAPTRPGDGRAGDIGAEEPSIATVPADAGRIAFSPFPPA